MPENAVLIAPNISVIGPPVHHAFHHGSHRGSIRAPDRDLTRNATHGTFLS